MGIPLKIRAYKLLRGELRSVLALTLVLLIFVGLGLAAGDTAITFDFGTGLSSEIAPGTIPVNGGTTLYPKVSQGITYGWTEANLAEHSDGSVVKSLLEMDTNQGVGNNNFRITGLSADYYTINIVSGTLNHPITTKIVVNGASYLINSDPKVWNTLTFKAAALAGNLELEFKRYGTNIWAVNAITIVPSSIPPLDANFDLVVLPTEHQVSAGGTAVYQISVIPQNGYSAEVQLSLSNPPNKMTTAFNPASGFPAFSSKLEITTSQDSAATAYAFDLIATGSDIKALSVNKRIILIVTPADSVDNINIISPIIDKAFLNQSKEMQRLIDIYTKAEKNRLPTTDELAALQELPAATLFAVLPELPQPRSIIDASLRQLTNAGIIGIVVDSAPAVDSTPPVQSGFFAQFFGSMFNPAR